MSKRSRSIASHEVSELKTLSLAGFNQKVLLDGLSKDLPILIYLHGGPGSPIPFNAGCRGLFDDFSSHFIMVYWDQMGCGINNCDIRGLFSVERFTQMTVDLIEQVHALFPDNKIYLFSTSWGSVLSVKAIQNTNSVDGVVAWGHVLTSPAINEYALDALRHSGMPADKLASIESLDFKNMQPADVKQFMNALSKYTDGNINHRGTSFPLMKVLWDLFRSPDYRFKDFKAVMNNGYTNNPEPFQVLAAINVVDDLTSVSIPYRILQGNTDVITPTAPVVEMVHTLQNPNVTCRVVEPAGHVPSMEGLEAILQELLILAGYTSTNNA